MAKPTPVPLTEVTNNPGIIYGKDQEGQYDGTFMIIKEVDGSSAAANHVVAELPIGAVVETVYIRNKTTSAIVTGTTVGVGITGDLEAFTLVAHTSLDAADDELWKTADVNHPRATATNLLIASTDGSNAATGTIAGTWYVKVTGKIHTKIAA